jgi:hypothetical protein
VADASDDDLFDALEAAEQGHLIDELPVDHPADYVFVHEQIRQTHVGELSLPRRQPRPWTRARVGLLHVRLTAVVGDHARGPDSLELDPVTADRRCAELARGTFVPSFKPCV